MKKEKNKINYQQPDWIYLIVVGLIIVFGLIMLASVGVSVGFEEHNDPNFYFKRQFFGVLLGLGGLVFFALVDYHFWQKIAKQIFLLAIGLNVLVFVPGIGLSSGGASRWIGVNGFSFQPSELLKLSALFFLASWLVENKETINKFKENFLIYILMVGGVVGLVLLQNDMGTAFIVTMISLSVYFISNGNFFYLVSFSSVGAVLFYFLIRAESYRMKRLTTFLHPELDPLGIGYHINQALLAIGSGGVFGLGYGLSRQKFMYLPEATTDSIFAIISEEMGFVIGVCLIAFYLWIFFRGVKIGENAPDLFGKTLAITISFWLIVQVLINIASMISLVPMTGIPLPFISYGRSSLIISMIVVGIMINISRQRKIS
jgi:cell division protein FtsW